MDEMICEVHGVPFEMADTPVVYGLWYYSEEYNEARNTLFPNATTSVSGGCVINEDEGFTVRPVCMECRKAEAKWSAEAELLEQERIQSEETSADDGN